MQGVRLIVRDFPYGTTEEQLRQLIEPHAKVLSLEFPRHATGEPKDFALVDVEDEAQAQEAVRHLHGHVWEGRRLRVKIAVPQKVGEGGPHVPEGTRGQAHEARPPVIERPERRFLRTSRSQRRV